MRYPDDAQIDTPYTVDNATAAAFTTVPGLPETDYAAALMLDQSGSVNSTDPTGARLFSAKAFVQTVDAASGDSVLLSAFADDNDTQTALIPTKPMTVYGDFTDDGATYFDELDDLAGQAAGGTPLYRSLFPEAGRQQCRSGIHDRSDRRGRGHRACVGSTRRSSCSPMARTRSAVVRTPAVSSGEHVIDHANAAGIEIFTIGLSDEVDFEALGELASGTEWHLPVCGERRAVDSAVRLARLAVEPQPADLRDGMDHTGYRTANTFVSGRSVLGRLQINAAGSPIQVPFIVGIP